MKELVNLRGVQTLNSNQQKEIQGGGKQKCCNPTLACCTTNPAPSACSHIAWGNPNCQYLYSTGCCI